MNSPYLITANIVNMRVKAFHILLLYIYMKLRSIFLWPALYFQDNAGNSVEPQSFRHNEGTEINNMTGGGEDSWW